MCSVGCLRTGSSCADLLAEDPRRHMGERYPRADLFRHIAWTSPSTQCPPAPTMAAKSAVATAGPRATVTRPHPCGDSGSLLMNSRAQGTAYPVGGVIPTRYDRRLTAPKPGSLAWAPANKAGRSIEGDGALSCPAVTFGRWNPSAREATP